MFICVDKNIGSHMRFDGAVVDTIKKGIDYGCYAIQFFLGNPQSFNRAKLKQTDIDEAKLLLDNFPIHMFSHFPYVCNLAGSKSILAWQGDAQDDKTTILIKHLQYELETMNNFYLPNHHCGVVIHPGNHVNEQKGLVAIAQSINKINFPEHAKLILENSAGGGTALATTLTQIKTIIDTIDPDKRKNIGVCLDTCHLFAYGDYDLSKIEQVIKLFDDFDAIIGSEYLYLIHLNDSETKLGSRADRHACIKQGYIWSENDESLLVLLKICNSRNIPIVLETTPMDMVTLTHL